MVTISTSCQTSSVEVIKSGLLQLLSWTLKSWVWKSTSREPAALTQSQIYLMYLNSFHNAYIYIYTYYITLYIIYIIYYVLYIIYYISYIIYIYILYHISYIIYYFYIYISLVTPKVSHQVAHFSVTASMISMISLGESSWVELVYP